ncbi:hypothetical protein EUTSA_v10000421mg, partial [Eutrema salsugineum]
PSSPSFSSVPDEIIANCLARISKSHYRSLSSVSKSFNSLLSSPEIYAARSHPGLERQSLTSIYVYAKEDKRSRSVRVFDCRSHTLRRAPKMTVARKGAKSCFLDGKIYVIGGCKKREEPMSWGEVFDIKTQTWKLLPSPSGHGFHPKHQVVVFGARLYVVTKQNKYAYDPKERRWLLEMGFGGSRTSSIRVWDLYTKRADKYRTIQLVNHGGKLVIIWHEWIDIVWRQNDGFERRLGIKGKRTCCLVIRLEKRLSSSGSEEVWGEIERLNVVVPTVPSSYDVLSCLSVSL